MAARDVYSTLSKNFCWPSRAKDIIGRDLKFARYVPHYKILTGNIFGLILKDKMATTGISLSVVVSSSGYMRSQYREQNSERYPGVIVSQIKPKFAL